MILNDKEVNIESFINLGEEENEGEENELRELFELDVYNNFGNSEGVIFQANLKFSNFNRNSYYNPDLNSTYRPPEQI
ncbi:MAG: hypothetical protein KJO77_03135 [Bacteroidia bacterium]|nr:hypothetical protein [Bacteroidia bacterium]NND52522.1 hypothetical protein [Flavobacteriaceae bacterium]